MRTRFWILALPLMALPAAAFADGLNASLPGAEPSRWHTRLELESMFVRAEPTSFGLGANQSWQSARLFSDYHLDALKFGQTSGLKLTSGLLVTQRGMSTSPEDDARSAWPYLGLGYSGGGQRGDWGFSADIGMAAQSLGAAVRLGRVFGGGLSASDALRDLRLQPVVRLGMTYSF